MKENEKRTVDCGHCGPPFGGAYINKDGITLRGAIFVSIGKQSPFTVKTLTAHPLTLSSPYRGIEGVRHLLQ